VKNVEVDTGQIAAVLPVRADLALQLSEEMEVTGGGAR